MQPNPQAVDDLVDGILDGTPIDWAAAESSAGPDQQPFLRQLRLLAALADVHREPAPATMSSSQLPLSGSAPVAADGSRLWGHLELRERVGRGKFGEVYRAWDTRLDREVALKLLPAGGAPGRPAASTFIHEGRLLARVRHPNVVTIYGAEAIGDRIGLWMEFVQGRTLEQVLDERKAVDAPEAIRIGLELCHALTAVHGAGLLHRDVKTQNVMQADDGRIVLMDFGTGRELGDGAASDLAGTPLYLAPEVLAGQAATVRSDVYSLGVLVYHLVTASYPVYARTLQGLRRAHERGERTGVQAARRDVPPRVARVIERAIDPDPARRYPSAEAMGAALAALRPRSKGVRLAYAAAGAALVVLAAGAAWEVAGRRAGSSTTPGALLAGLAGSNPAGAANAARLDRPVIAVLPLENLSAEAESDYFVDGLTDEIIRNLAAIDGLAVRSRTSSFAFKDKPRNLPEVGALLGANLVVEGSILKSGDRVRINLQLVQVASDTPLWAERFDRELRDIFAIQDDVSRAIVNRLRLTVGQGRRRYETNLPAYELYLKALALAERHGISDPRQAVALFEQVIARDPRFAPAHAGLAFAYASMSMPIRGPQIPAVAPEEALTVMREAARRAVDLDPLLPEAHAALGLAYSRERDWQNAQKSFQRALELGPTLTQITSQYSISTLIPLGRIAEAERLARMALQNDPLSLSVKRELALVQFATGRYEEAIENFERIRAIDPHFPYADIELARALTFAGRPAEALRVLEGRSAEEGVQYWLAYPYVLTGRRAEVERMAAAHTHPFRLGVIHAALGDTDRALAELDRAADVVPHRVALLVRQPEVAALRGDPRFAAVLRKLGLPE